MATYTDGPTKTFTAGETLAAFRRVKYSSSNTVVYSGAGEVWIGTTLKAIANESSGPVRLRNASGTTKMTAAGAFAVGALLYAAASGKVDDVATGQAVGRCGWQAATADGEIVEVLPENALQADGLTSPHITVGLEDANGKESINMTATASAVDELTVANAATGGTVALSATGDDTNIPISLAGKGTGLVALGQSTSTGVKLTADQPILDSSSNELLKFTKATSAVNEITAANAATTAAPGLSATGGDTNVSLNLTPKGTGVVRIKNLMVDKKTQTAKTDTATLTAAEILTGIIDGTPTAAAGYTLPTAADLVAAIANAAVGDSFRFAVNNKSAGANTITMAAGSGGTADGTLTVAQNVIRDFLVIITNVTGSAEAYFVYGIGA